MLFLKKCFAALFLTLLLASCTSPAPISAPALLPRTDEATMRARAGQLAEVLAAIRIRGVGVDLAGRHDPVTREQADAIAAHIAEFGFNRIYCAIDDADKLNESFRLLVEGAAKKNIGVEVAVYQRDFFYTYHGNAVTRHFRSRKPTLPEIALKIVDFNDALPDDAKLAGLTVMVEPHIFTRANSNRPKDLLYAWGPNTFGAGLDNDMMMRDCFAMLDRIEVSTASLPLTIGIADFYHELAVEKKITCGTITDFLTVSPHGAKVLLQNRGNKPSEAVEAVAAELGAAESKNAILIGINLAEHTSVATGAYRRRDWRDLIRSLDFLIGQWKKSPAFAGAVIGPLSVIELIQQEE